MRHDLRQHRSESSRWLGIPRLSLPRIPLHLRSYHARLQLLDQLLGGCPHTQGNAVTLLANVEVPLSIKTHRIVRVATLCFTKAVEAFSLFTHSTRHLVNLHPSALTAFNEHPPGSHRIAHGYVVP